MTENGFIVRADLTQKKILLLFEISRVLVRLDHVASGIINGDHSIMWPAEFFSCQSWAQSHKWLVSRLS